jgi:glycosyltransferase involved in cell wall biosynthesis
MMEAKQVVFFFRKPKPHYHSIERVFNLIVDHLSNHIHSRKYYLHDGDKGIFSRLKALWEVHKAKGPFNHITGDISYAALALPKKGLIVTFHDLESLERGSRIKTTFLKWIWVVWPARRAEKVTVISEHTKLKVMEWAKIEEAKITVIPNPLPNGFEYTPKAFNAQYPIVLAMGTKPNKNLEGTIDAIKDIPCKLIIAGHLHPYQLELLNKNRIDYENLVGATDSQIIDAYKRCDMLCFPSFYEGFGMPIIEAQAVGRLVITSNVGAMPVTAGEGAILVDPKKSDEIGNAIQKAIHEAPLRKTLVEVGLKNAATYSLQKIARVYSSLYQ